MLSHASTFRQPSNNYETEYKTVKFEFSKTERAHQEKGRKIRVFTKVGQVDYKTPISVMPFFPKALLKLLRTMIIIKSMILLGRKQTYLCDKNYFSP